MVALDVMRVALRLGLTVHAHAEATHHLDVEHALWGHRRGEG